MRFIHISDVRLGLNPESEKRFGRQRALELKETFKKIVDRAAEEGCDLLLVSGGIFCHQPVSTELSELNRILSALPGTEVVIIAGKRDVLKKSAPVQSFRWAPNIHYVTEAEPTRLYFPAINTAVYAASRTEAATVCAADYIRMCRERFLKTETAAARILLLPEADGSLRFEAEGSAAEEPGTVSGSVSAEALLSDFSYAAFGGARRRELIPGRAACAGATEPASMAESGAHGMMVGDLSTATGRMIGLSFVPMAAASYIPLLVNVTEKTSADELYRTLTGEMEKRGKSNIYRIRLSGRRSPEEIPDLAPLLGNFRIAEIVDETEPQYDFSALFEEHPQDMIGFYISWLKRNDNPLSALEKKAMYYGIRALLQTSGKR